MAVAQLCGGADFGPASDTLTFKFFAWAEAAHLGTLGRRTVNDYNARVSATFEVVAPDLEPDIVTKTLAMFPSRSSRAGELLDVRKENGEPILLATAVSKYGYWKAFIPEDLRGAPLESQLDYWREILLPKQVQIEQLADRGWELVIDCFFLVNAFELIELPAAMLRTFGQLGISLDIHVFSHRDADSSAPAV